MNIADLIQNSARTIWSRKHLMVLGIFLVAITTGIRLQDTLITPLLKPMLALLDVPATWLPTAGYDWPTQLLAWVEAHGTMGWTVLAIGAVLLGILLGVSAIITRGALIASAGDPLSLGAALKTGWRKAWRLIIIASIPPIPVIVAAILIVVLVTVVIQQAGGIDAVSSSAEMQQRIAGGLLIASLVIMLPFYAVTFVLGLLSTLADRACVLEDCKVIESYRRGWRLLRSNIQSAAILALLHIILSGLISSMLVLPEVFSMLCVAAAPLVWVVRGVENTFLVTMWTLAWHEWAGALKT